MLLAYLKSHKFSRNASFTGYFAHAFSRDFQISNKFESFHKLCKNIMFSFRIFFIHVPVPEFGTIPSFGMKHGLLKTFQTFQHIDTGYFKVERSELFVINHFWFRIVWNEPCFVPKLGRRTDSGSSGWNLFCALPQKIKVCQWCKNMRFLIFRCLLLDFKKTKLSLVPRTKY